MKNIQITFEINRQHLIYIATSLIANSRSDDDLNLTKKSIREALTESLRVEGLEFDLLDIESHPILSRDDIDSIAEETINTLYPEYKEAPANMMPIPNDKCYDCGSTIDGHHTALCDFAEKGDILDLPMQAGTQWWTGEVPVTDTYVKPLHTLAYINGQHENGVLICSDCHESCGDKDLEYIADNPEETDSPIGTCDWCHDEIKFKSV